MRINDVQCCVSTASPAAFLLSLLEMAGVKGHGKTRIREYYLQVRTTWEDKGARRGVGASTCNTPPLEKTLPLLSSASVLHRPAETLVNTLLGFFMIIPHPNLLTINRGKSHLEWYRFHVATILQVFLTSSNPTDPIKYLEKKNLTGLRNDSACFHSPHSTYFRFKNLNLC